MKYLCILACAVFFVQSVASAQVLSPVEAESNIAFTIKNIGIDVDGTLSGLKGKLYFDTKKLPLSYFDVTVAVNTIHTGIEKRDNHLKTEDFFDAAKYPVIQIKTTNISAKGNNNFLADAILTLHGISKNIQFAFVALPQSNGYTFTSTFTLNRRTYGVGGNSITLSDNVTVNLKVVAKK